MKSKSMEDEIPYTFEVAPMYQEIALKYLHENDNIRAQALTQFREWIIKDPNIKSCRMDSVFLLKFLRTKKFNIPSALQILKEYLSIFVLYPKWFTKMCASETRLIQLFLDGVFIPLAERDEDGRQIIIYNLKNIDPEIYTQHDYYRLQSLCYHTCFEEEETQIAGYVVVFNFSGIDMKRFAMFNLIDFSNFASLVRYAVPMRLNKVFILNMPKYVQPLYEIAINLMTPKIKKRVQLIKSKDDFKKHVDISIYPKEFGGEQEMTHILNQFVKKMENYSEELRSLDKLKIDIPNHKNREWYLNNNNNSRIGSGMVGSFRRLAVD